MLSPCQFDGNPNLECKDNRGLREFPWCPGPLWEHGEVRLLSGQAGPAIRVLSVTPDPGVIEVNLHPAATWQELCANIFALDEEARSLRLGAEKFMPDGRRIGTGGGNHMTLGGPTPADSP